MFQGNKKNIMLITTIKNGLSYIDNLLLSQYFSKHLFILTFFMLSYLKNNFKVFFIMENYKTLDTLNKIQQTHSELKKLTPKLDKLHGIFFDYMKVLKKHYAILDYSKYCYCY